MPLAICLMSLTFLGLNFEQQDAERFMAEYLIVGVAYSSEEKHIDWVFVSREVDKKLSFFSVVGNQLVVDLIKSKSATFKTATIDLAKLKYYIGADVQIYDGEFLTTSPDASEANNLENLPVFSMPNEDIEKSLAAKFPFLVKAE
jgi:hypothetical protein